MSNFSKESLSTAAKSLEPVKRETVSRVHERLRPSEGNLTQRSQPAPASPPNRNETRLGHQATPLDSSATHTNTNRGLASRASIVPANLSTVRPALQDTRKFDFILSWATIPAAPRMLNSQKKQLSAQAAALFRAIDKDGNGKLNSVEFFEGMISEYGLSRDQVLHIINILKLRQQGFYAFEEFQEIYFAIETNLAASEVVELSDSPQHQQPRLEPVDGDDDICVIYDSPSPMADHRHPNPTALSPKNAGNTCLCLQLSSLYAASVTM